ncbi:MAG: DUF5688 family protein [Butyrivibrio sp.]|nr:DUF5688 family protein [Butyrivibrio sp.]
MDFETFKENLVKDVKEMLDARTGGDTLVETRTVDKMNETYDAITVKPEDSIIGVNLNATNLYKEFEDGRFYDEIAKSAADSDLHLPVHRKSCGCLCTISLQAGNCLSPCTCDPIETIRTIRCSISSVCVGYSNHSGGIFTV